jgi:hypothetical protein
MADDWKKFTGGTNNADASDPFGVTGRMTFCLKLRSSSLG